MKYEDLKLKDGSTFPKLGLGTWYLGETPSTYEEEKNAIITGIKEGIKLIDTAEMYGNGLSEQLVGDAIKDFNRDDLYLVSKVLPSNAGGRKLEKSLDATLKRLGTDHLDCYLYHWRGSFPLDETVDRMEEMVEKGKILRWGVSNFDTADMEELLEVPNGRNCVVNQVLYHLGSRGIEYDLLPYMKEEGIGVMAYCPLAQGGSLRRQLMSNATLQEVAKKYDISVMQLLLAFVMHIDNVSAIPRSGNASHVLANAKMRDIVLSDEDYKLVSSQFPAPNHKTFLDVV
ncbi:aldo/keto reductase [Lachnospira pectinoschiza]|uniref:Aldo/keto reductase n=1 Tax=Lachnospira pectinoschiza TaxID=28052 RepID=A0A1G9U1P0_9FIRM|nr:aldo/keto reductase [Lachnospira pectinoschiza]SDM53465.1 Aldo/keto reductase [Lachnospira pectinoschiza]